MVEQLRVLRLLGENDAGEGQTDGLTDGDQVGEQTAEVRPGVACVGRAGPGATAKRSRTDDGKSKS